MNKIEKTIELTLLVCALSSIIAIFLIIFFIISNGIPIIMKEGLIEFLTGTKWMPSYEIYGIFPMIISTIAVTLLALIIGFPLGLGCAILIAEVAPSQARDILRPAIETLAGIPSVVYGFFGLLILIPFILNTFGGDGYSVLACGLILAVMILPTIISVSEDAIRAVPNEFREGSLALGATKWQVITGIIVPTARSGIIASAILGMGRAIGETMAVLMVGGTVVMIPDSLLSPVAPLTAVIALEWGYASGDHQIALFAVGIVLLIVIMALNIVIYMANKQKSTNVRV
jgi:phosphate transport system permease protein